MASICDNCILVQEAEISEQALIKSLTATCEAGDRVVRLLEEHRLRMTPNKDYDDAIDAWYETLAVARKRMQPARKYDPQTHGAGA